MIPASPVIPGQDLPEVIYGKDQPEYLPLPALVNTHGEVLTRWQMNWHERLRALLTGNVYLTVLTFNRPIQPVNLSVYDWTVYDWSEEATLRETERLAGA